MKRYLLSITIICLWTYSFIANAEKWQDALAGMPLTTNLTELNRFNAVKTMVESFQSNSTVKALIFMPGATDEFYMFRRAKASLTNTSPSLLDAVAALTNQTFIRATFKDHFLLLHTAQDPLKPIVHIKDRATAKAIEKRLCENHFEFYDKDWDYLLPHLGKSVKVALSPGLFSPETFHFYRHSFSAWNLNGSEGLRAVAMAGKTQYEIITNAVIFRADDRVLAPVPDLQSIHFK